jgi:hypothetical protein
MYYQTLMLLPKIPTEASNLYHIGGRDEDRKETEKKKKSRGRK